MSRATSAANAVKKQAAKPATAVQQKAMPASPAARPTPTKDELRRRAYSIYQSRVAKGLPGTPDSDWLQAERELGS